MICVYTRIDPLDEYTLVGIDDVHSAPLEKKTGHGDSSASHEITGIVGRLHRVSLSANEEVSILECRYNVPLALVFKHRLLTHQRTSHCVNRYERNTIARTI